MRFVPRLTYANVMSTIALFIALGGTAAAAGPHLLTGKDVRDHSLTGIDVANHSLGARALTTKALKSLRGDRGERGAQGSTGSRGPAGPAGPAGTAGATGATGATGQQGPAGVGITTESVQGSDQTNYVDLTPLATYSISKAGDYVIFTKLTVANTGATDEYLNCGYRVNGVLNGASGVDTTSGSTSSGTSAGVVSADGPTTVEFLCQGGGGTSYDISNVSMRAHFLG